MSVSFKKFKNIGIRIAATSLAISMMASCATKTPAVTVDPMDIPMDTSQEIQQPVEVPETLGGEKPTVSEASDALWEEINRKAQEAEEAKRKIAEALAEAERLEAEKIEAERIEAERIEAERIEAERLAEEQRLAEEAARLAEEERLRAEEEARQSHNIDVEAEEIVVDEPDSWKISGEDTASTVVSDIVDESYVIHDTSADRILEGDPSTTSMPSWLLSPDEHVQEIQTSSPEVVNIYHPIVEEKEEDTVTAEDILAIGTKYEANRESKLAVKEMNREQLVAKILEILELTGPYILMGLCAVFVILILRFLVKKIINPKRKAKEKVEEGVEVIADGYMVSRPGTEEDPNAGQYDAQDLPDDKAADFQPEKEDAPDYDPRSGGADTEYPTNEYLNDLPSWKPQSREEDSESDSSGESLIPN